MKGDRPLLAPSVIDDARRLWDEGLPAREIAQRMNRSVNSVIGMAHRNGFAARPNPIIRMSDEDRARVLALADEQPTWGIRRLAASLALSDSTVTTVLRKERPGRIAVAAPTMLRVAPKEPRRDGPATASGAGGSPSQRALSPRAAASPAEPRVKPAPLPAWITGPKPGCSWPIGEPGTPDFRYCDAPRAVRCYCAEHAAVAYRRATPGEERLARVRRA